MRSLLVVVVLMLSIGAIAAPPALADEFQPVRDREAFLEAVVGRDLRIALYDLTLRVAPDGEISGKALGSQVSGKWKWQDGYFCRDMNWGGREIGYDCQLVEQRGASALRFTASKGSGRRAVFRLQ